MMRAIWSGALNFGLVDIPVKLYAAAESARLDLDMLHRKDLKPIRYARVCRAEGKEVRYADVVKGYEYKKGDYIVLTEEDFRRANVRKTRLIDIVEFADAAEIDPIYYEKPYYLRPEKGSEKAYRLLRDALKRSGKMGIATFVLRGHSLAHSSR